MVNQDLLFKAKAFLCWDKFPNLSIKLIPIEGAVAFFYPPTQDNSTINLFYEKQNQDLSRALCLLFHEAGHFSQLQKFLIQDRTKEFWDFINLDKGESKIAFEQEAWDFGSELLSEFLAKINMDQNILINVYKSYAAQSLLTYK